MHVCAYRGNIHIIHVNMCTFCKIVHMYFMYVYVDSHAKMYMGVPGQDFVRVFCVCVCYMCLYLVTVKYFDMCSRIHVVHAQEFMLCILKCKHVHILHGTSDFSRPRSLFPAISTRDVLTFLNLEV